MIFCIYAFAYDGLSRLKSASYLMNGAASSNNSVSGITYDKHGNMKTIQRRGKTTASAYGVIDNLTMTHAGNQLTGVIDAGSTVSISESNDFKKGSTAATQYTYNKNGAMSKDLNKSISAISYNLLNLPAQVTIGGVTHKYTYSADGRKLRVEQGTTNRDYVGSVIYENGSLKRVLIDGGYVDVNGSINTYYYYLNDHLGNTRVVASGNGTILQTNHYYPFGMPFADTANAEQDKQPYKFGGKEFERKNGLNLYDFEARQMDPAIARFTSMDPMAEKYYSVSPYAYVMNNPINAVDKDGRKVVFVNGYLGFGSPEGGPAYWGGEHSSFVTGAQSVFNDYAKPYFTDQDYKPLHSVKYRRNAGYEYAQNNYSDLTSGMTLGEDVFRIVSHSMGAAFAEGIIEYLQQQGWTVDIAIHLNAWQPQLIDLKNEGTKVIDATLDNDWIQDLSTPSWTNSIPGADLRVRKWSKKGMSYIHKDFINNGGLFNPELNTNLRPTWNEVMQTIQSWLNQNPDIIIK